MKRFISSCVLFVLCAFTSMAQSLQTVSLNTAKNLVAIHYTGQDVDYFYASVTNPVVNGVKRMGLYWLIFVDEEPMKGWEHNCKSYYVSKTQTNVLPFVEARTTPPSVSLTKLTLANRYGNKANMKITVAKSPLLAKASINSASQLNIQLLEDATENMKIRVTNLEAPTDSKEFKVEGGYREQTFSCPDVKKGIYVVSLYDGNTLINSVRLVKQSSL